MHTRDSTEFIYGDASQMVPLGAEAVKAAARLIASSCEYTIENISYTYTPVCIRVSTHAYTSVNVCMYGDASQMVPLGAEAVNATARLIASSCEYMIKNITSCSYTMKNITSCAHIRIHECQHIYIYIRVSTNAYTSFNRVHIWRCVPDGPLGRQGHEGHRAFDRLELRKYD